MKNSKKDCKESQKVYVCLFTCASTRAVHLELTRGLSVKSFLLAFRKFTSQRGLPATITSDNAKTFRSSSQDIRKITWEEEVWRYLANKQITWNFTVEKARLWEDSGKGLWEASRNPREVYTLRFDELDTVLVEIEAVINSRLLTYMYDDEESLSYPSDLIYTLRFDLIWFTVDKSHQLRTRKFHEMYSSRDKI